MSEPTFDDVALRAREAAYELALATRATKDHALLAMADALVAASAEVLAANEARRGSGHGDGCRAA
jgi:glutamate-5-semialdehyde dehydrogenase